MSQYKDVAVGSTVYFWFAANLTTGAAGDGATPLYDVRLAGAASDAAPTASGTPTLLTHANYTDGLHEIAIDSTGYSAGSEYAVFCTLTISTVNPAGFVGSFVVRAAASALGDAIARVLTALPNAAPDAAGGLPISDAGGLDMDAILSRIGTPANLGGGTATLAGNLADIEAQTDDIGAAGAGLTAIPTIAAVTTVTTTTNLTNLPAAAATAAELAKVPKSDGTVSWNATALGAIQSEATDALNAYDPPTKAELDTAQGAVTLANVAHGGAAAALTLGGGAAVNITGNLSGSVGLVTGAVGSVTGAVGSVTGLTASDVGAIKAKTDNLPTDPADESLVIAATDAIMTRLGAGGAGLTAVPWNVTWDAEVQSEVVDALDETIADSVPADGTRPSVRQGIYLLTQFMMECAVSGTTMTIKKPDGTTALLTLTLNDATNPTSRTRAT